MNNIFVIIIPLLASVLSLFISITYSVFSLPGDEKRKIMMYLGLRKNSVNNDIGNTKDEEFTGGQYSFEDFPVQNVDDCSGNKTPDSFISF